MIRFRATRLLLLAALALTSACGSQDAEPQAVRQSPGQPTQAPVPVTDTQPDPSTIQVGPTQIELDYTGERPNDPSTYTSETLVGGGKNVYLILESGIHRFDATDGTELSSMNLLGAIDGTMVGDELFVVVEHASTNGTTGFNVARVGSNLDGVRAMTAIPDNRGLDGIANADEKVLVSYLGGAGLVLANLENDSLNDFATAPDTNTVGLTFAQGNIWQMEQGETGFVQRVDVASGRILQTWRNMRDARSLEADTSGGYVGVADANNNYRLMKLRPDGSTQQLANPVVSPQIALGNSAVWLAAGNVLSAIDRDTGQVLNSVGIPAGSYDDIFALGDTVWLVGRHDTGNLFLLRYQLHPAIGQATTIPSPSAETASTPGGAAGGRWTDPILTVTAQSLGAVHVGMTLREAESASGVTFDASDDGARSSTSLPAGHAQLWVRGDPITCVGAGRGNPANPPAQKVSTQEGVQVGDTVEQLLAVYGDAATKMASSDTGRTSFNGYEVAQPDGALAFQIDSNNTIVNISGVASTSTDGQPNHCPG